MSATDTAACSSTDLDEMVGQYVATALWSSTDDEGEPLDSTYDYSDISPETLAEMREDCQAFAEANVKDLDGMDPGQAGHDFWLTRNHHGAGFWDRGLDDLGDRLTEAAHVYGGVDLYIGDDGLIYS